MIALTARYRALFVIDDLTFLLFFAIIHAAIAETRPPSEARKSFFQG
jgi:hypothetical protein